METLTRHECEQIAEILDRRANEIAGYCNDYRNDTKHYGSVELAMTREISRLRKLSIRICPPQGEKDEQ